MFPTSRLFALFLLAVTASSCAILGGSPPERYGGGATLTQAAQEAAKDSAEKHRRLDVGHEVPPAPSETEVVVEGTSELSESSVETGDGGDDSGDRRVLGVVAGGGSLGGHEFEGFGFGGLDIGSFINGRWRFDVGLLVLSPNLSATSLAGQGLKNEVELGADLSGRFYITPPHTFLGVYPLVGFRFGTLFWDYVTPVDVIADGYPKTIGSDHLDYFALYGGLGVSLVQTRHFSTGFNLTTGFRSYDETTYEGFDNTLFPTTGYMQLGFEMVYKF